MQVQGMIAEYERAKIMDAVAGASSTPPATAQSTAQCGAPTATVTSAARGRRRGAYQVVADEARVVRQIFEWVGQERCSSVRFADVSDVTAFPRGPANRPGTAR